MRITLSGTALWFVLATLAVAQTKVKTVPPQDTSAVSGKEMFVQYCASCHGTSGKGDGPAAPALKIKPADLTALAAHNNGKFPAERVSLYIEGADQVEAHGSREMPVWGKVFKSMSENEHVAKLRVANLTAYVNTLQAK